MGFRIEPSGLFEAGITTSPSSVVTAPGGRDLCIDNKGDFVEASIAAASSFCSRR
jgi:hypothetical protein